MQLPLVAVLGVAAVRRTASTAGRSLGAAIIFVANAYIAHREAQLSRHAETSAPIEAAKPGE